MENPHFWYEKRKKKKRLETERYREICTLHF